MGFSNNKTKTINFENKTNLPFKMGTKKLNKPLIFFKKKMNKNLSGTFAKKNLK